MLTSSNGRSAASDKILFDLLEMGSESNVFNLFSTEGNSKNSSWSPVSWSMLPWSLYAVSLVVVAAAVGAGIEGVRAGTTGAGTTGAGISTGAGTFSAV